MTINELTLPRKVSRTRVGRGISAGGGKTAGRGTKGQKARTGKKIKLGFEGGQTKLAMRLPKLRGFTHARAVEYKVLNLSNLIALTTKSTKALGPKDFFKANLTKKINQPVKLLGNGAVNQALTVSVHAVSKSAEAAIVKAGGSVTILPVESPQQAAIKLAEAKKTDRAGKA